MKQLIIKSIGLWLNLLSLVAPRLAARKGFDLFRHPIRGKLQAYHYTFYDSADKFDFMLQGETIQAYRWGHGDKKILFVHGWQSHSFRWKNYIEALDKERYTLYAFDAPAHGLSTGRFMTVPQYGEAIEKIIKKIGKLDVVVGHSVGSFTSVYTFYSNPELSPNKMVALAMPSSASEFLDVFKTTLGLTERSMKLIIDHFVSVVNLTPEHFTTSVFVEKLDFPALMIHDEDDDETSVKHTGDIHRIWKGSRLIITKGIGHNLKSKEVVMAVVDFIGENSVLRVNGVSNLAKQ
jgi:pimeloyl-ACP methyl ester carboxylesterase